MNQAQQMHYDKIHLYYKFKEKTYYEGEFKNNKRHGYGEYYLKNKLKYNGEFKDDEYDGRDNIFC